jgi:hypothetical protein
MPGSRPFRLIGASRRTQASMTALRELHTRSTRTLYQVAAPTWRFGSTADG